MFNKKLNERLDRQHVKLCGLETQLNKMQYRLDAAVWHIPSSYVVEPITRERGMASSASPETIGWTVAKYHPILGKTVSQPFPTEGCAKKALESNFNLLQFGLNYKL